MAEIIYNLIYQPLFNILIFFYNITPFPDLGIAVILLTVLIKGVLYPLGIKAAKSQKEMQAIQPDIKKIQEKYKEDKEEQAKKIMELYKERGVNPFSGMLPLFIQLPILVALFQIFTRGLENEEMKHLYNFISTPEVVNYNFLNIIDLSSPNIILAVIAAAGQYIQMKMVMGGKKEEKKEEGKKADMAKAMQTQMMYFLPGFTFIVLLSLPSAVGLYWIVTVIFSVYQQYSVRDKEEEVVVEKDIKKDNKKTDKKNKNGRNKRNS